MPKLNLQTDLFGVKKLATGCSCWDLLPTLGLGAPRDSHSVKDNLPLASRQLQFERIGLETSDRLRAQLNQASQTPDQILPDRWRTRGSSIWDTHRLFGSQPESFNQFIIGV